MKSPHEPHWATLEVSNEPGEEPADELSPIYDFNTRRDHWSEWRSFRRGRGTLNRAQLLVWLVLSVLLIVFFFLYLAERSKSHSTSNAAPSQIPSSHGQHVFYSQSGYEPFTDFEMDRDARGVSRVQYSNRGMVTSDVGECSDMGGEILKKGGNAIDAAVTTALCVGIRNPHSSGTGGGSFILIHLKNGSNPVIDAREVAPIDSGPDLYKGRGAIESTNGGLSIGVPLELKGLEMMSDLYGKLTWKELVMPVVPLARDGFSASRYMVYILARAFSVGEMSLLPNAFRDTYFIAENALAKTLERMAEEGVEAVYNSDWGDDLIEDIRGFAWPGILKKRDLTSAKPVLKEAIKSTVFGMDVYTVPPPSSGAVLVMALRFLDSYRHIADDAVRAHLKVEAMKHLFAVRSHLGDPGVDNAFLDLDQLLSDILQDSYTRKLRKKSSKSFVLDPSLYGGKYSLEAENQMESGTSHICTADDEGNAVSLTTTINMEFGSFVVSEKTGLILNNEMDDFTKPGILTPDGTPALNSSGSARNLIYPGRKPLSSMSPMIFVKDGQLRLAVGAAGGLFITPAVLQIVYDHLGHGVDLFEAMQAGRVYDLLRGQTFYEVKERGSVSFEPAAEIKQGLTERGHVVVPCASCGTYAQALEVTQDGMFRGVPDPRKDGAAASNL